jgi:hypothetical protein
MPRLRTKYHIEPVALNSTPNERLVARLEELANGGWEIVSLCWPTYAHILLRRREGD